MAASAIILRPSRASALPLILLLLLPRHLTLINGLKTLPGDPLPLLPVYDCASPIITKTNLPQIPQQQVIPSTRSVCQVEIDKQVVLGEAVTCIYADQVSFKKQPAMGQEGGYSLELGCPTCGGVALIVPDGYGQEFTL